MRKLVCAWLALASVSCLGPLRSAAQTIPGIVLDDSVRAPLLGATIVTVPGQPAAVSDVRGRFALPLPSQHSCALTVSSLGYRTQVITLAPTARPDTLRIYLKRAATALGEVIVQGQRLPVSVDVDKLTVEASAYKGSPDASADNLLRLVPGVSLGAAGELKIRGDASIQVLLDGKPTLLSGRQFSDWLRTLPVSAVKQIEVQAPSAARLDAEKTGGAINIVLQKQLLDGYRGNLNLGAGTRFNNQAAGSLILKKGRLNLTTSGGLYTHPNGGALYSERNGITPDGTPYQLTQTGLRTAHDYSLNLGAILNWEVDSTLLVAARVQHDGFKLWADNEVTYRNTGGAAPAEEFTIDQRRNLGDKGTSGSLSLNKTYSRGRKLLGDVLYGYQTEVIDNTLYQDGAEQGHDRFQSAKHEGAAQVRLEQPLGKLGKLEIGSKGVVRLSNSEYPAIGTAATEHVGFNQYTAALYGLHNVSLGQVKLQYGVRGEYLASYFRANQAADYNQYYFNLFPSFSALRNLSPTLSVRFTYARKTRRPGISYLNTFVDRRDPKNVVVGNTTLTPEFKDLLDVSATLLKSKVTVVASLYFRYAHNAIAAYIAPTVGNQVVTTYTNADLEVATGFSPSVTANLGKLAINSTLDFAYYHLADRTLGLGNAGLLGGINADVSYRFNKQWFVDLTGNYDTRRILLNGTSSAWNAASLSVQHTMQEKYVLTLRVQDIFNSSHFVNRYYGDGFTYNTDYRPTFQAVILSATYRFGKKFTRKEASSTLRLDDVSEKSNR